jgi:hypothetical protein
MKNDLYVRCQGCGKHFMLQFHLITSPVLQKQIFSSTFWRAHVVTLCRAALSQVVFCHGNRGEDSSKAENHHVAPPSNGQIGIKYKMRL